MYNSIIDVSGQSLSEFGNGTRSEVAPGGGNGNFYCLRVVHAPADKLVDREQK